MKKERWVLIVFIAVLMIGNLGVQVSSEELTVQKPIEKTLGHESVKQLVQKGLKAETERIANIVETAAIRPLSKPTAEELALADDCLGMHINGIKLGLEMEEALKFMNADIETCIEWDDAIEIYMSEPWVIPYKKFMFEDGSELEFVQRSSNDSFKLRAFSADTDWYTAFGGIQAGDSVEKLIQLYGEPEFQLQNQLIYYRLGSRYIGDGCYVFTTDGSRITRIGMEETIQYANGIKGKDLSFWGSGIGDEESEFLKEMVFLGFEPVLVKEGIDDYGVFPCKTYRFSGLEVVLNDHSNERGYVVGSFTLTTSQLATSRGLRVGDSLEDAVRLYGKPLYINPDGSWDYAQPGGDYCMYNIMIENGIVTQISATACC